MVVTGSCSWSTPTRPIRHSRLQSFNHTWNVIVARYQLVSIKRCFTNTNTNMWTNTTHLFLNRLRICRLCTMTQHWYQIRQAVSFSKLQTANQSSYQLGYDSDMELYKPVYRSEENQWCTVVLPGSMCTTSSLIWNTHRPLQKSLPFLKKRESEIMK